LCKAYDILQHAVIQREVGDDLLESAVLVFQVLEATGFIDIKSAVLGFPPMVSLFADAVAAANISDLPTGLNTLEQVDYRLCLQSASVLCCRKLVHRAQSQASPLPTRARVLGNGAPAQQVSSHHFLLMTQVARAARS
jgi:hypothetical protein